MPSPAAAAALKAAQEAASTLPPIEQPRSPSTHEDLRVSLTLKLLKKYSPQVANNQTDKFIEKEVANLCQQPKISEKDLQALELKIRKFSHFEVEDILLMPFKNIAAKRAGLSDEWAVINQLAAKEGEKLAKTKESTIRDRNKDHKKHLNRQLEEKEKVVEHKKGAKAEDRMSIIKANQEFLKSAVSQQEKERLFKLEERQMREAEMEAARAKRDAERNERIQYEKDEVQRVRDQLKADMYKTMAMKQEQVEKLSAWKHENEVSKQIKAKEDEKKRLNDIAMTRQAMAALEKQERARLEALADLKEKMKGKEALALAQGAKMAELAAEDERKAQILQNEIKRKAEEAFRDMLAKKEKKKIELIKGLEEMKVAQEKVKEKEREAEVQQALWFKKLYLEGLKKDIEKREVSALEASPAQHVCTWVLLKKADALLQKEQEKLLKHRCGADSLLPPPSHVMCGM
jgi:hypothetical protein